jgi:hypothetical protein
MGRIRVTTGAARPRMASTGDPVVIANVDARLADEGLAQLRSLLCLHFPGHDVLILAAAAGSDVVRPVDGRS